MKIRLHPINIELEGDPNKSLLQICNDNKIELKSVCKGVPSCAECRIKVLAGESNLIPPNKAELSLIGTSYYIDGRRLACQIHAYGDISVDITDHLDKEDNTNKKIRGFRAAPGQTRESKAVQGTLVLQEPGEPAPVAREPRSGGAGGGRGRGPGKPQPQQKPHPGDQFVAGQEHHETAISADLDGSGDEGVFDVHPDDPEVHEPVRAVSKPTPTGVKTQPSKSGQDQASGQGQGPGQPGQGQGRGGGQRRGNRRGRRR